MNDTAMNPMELKTEEMEQAAGGYRKLPDKGGFRIYQIRKGDTLHKISLRIGCSVSNILSWNPQITNSNRIYSGDYLYLPEDAKI